MTHEALGGPQQGAICSHSLSLLMGATMCNSPSHMP